MKLPLHIANHLSGMMSTQSTIPSSELKHPTVNLMLQNGVLSKKQLSNTRAAYYIPSNSLMLAYLENQFGIRDLDEYIRGLSTSQLSRAEAVQLSGDSKLTSVRTFKGFLVNSYTPISASLFGKDMNIQPRQGTFTFIRDYEQFNLDPDITIVGIENAENFYEIKKLNYLFTHIQPLFASRYPQSHDLIKWLSRIANPYLHFGDLDFAGIQIYQNEFKKHLGNKATFFLPDQTEELLQQYGNRNLFNKQFKLNRISPDHFQEPGLMKLWDMMMKYKKVLEQEIFIAGVSDASIFKP